MFLQFILRSIQLPPEILKEYYFIEKAKYKVRIVLEKYEVCCFLPTYVPSPPLIFSTYGCNDCMNP